MVRDNQEVQKFLKIIILLILVVNSACVEAAYITSPFGWRIHPITGDYRFHSGLDIGYEYGDPIVAMLRGKVVFAGQYGGYGNCIIIEHEDGDYTLYAHCSRLIAEDNNIVEKGECIAYVGSSGISTGPHLHLEWWREGKYVDPIGLWDDNE